MAQPGLLSSSLSSGVSLFIHYTKLTGSQLYSMVSLFLSVWVSIVFSIYLQFRTQEDSHFDNV